MYNKTAPHFETPFFLIALERETEFLRQLCGARLDQNGAVGKNDRGDAPHPVVELFDEGYCFGMAVNINIIILDAILAKELFDAPAIGTPDGAVDNDFIGHDSSAPKTGWAEESLRKK
jgi:hypothetical protein